MTDVLAASMDRLCISAIGADAATYLHSQLSNDVASMTDGESRYSFVLEPTGKIVALVRVTRLGTESFLLNTDAVAGLEDVLMARLNKFRIRVKVDFTAEVRRCAAIRSTSDDVIADSVRTACAQVPSAAAVEAWWGDGHALDVLPTGPGVDIESIIRFVSDTDISGDSQELLEVARVRAGWPAMNHEIVSGETLVAATGIASRAVSFTKGCYPGQELVERMDSRGSSAPRVLRRFSRADVPCSDPNNIDVGDVLTVDGSDIGVVTSVAGEWVLAYVSRNADVGDPVTPAD
jgi:tRNA-modifying protein YgfZ